MDLFEIFLNKKKHENGKKRNITKIDENPLKK